VRTVTAPLRKEHLDLLPHIERLRTIADGVGVLTEDELRREVDSIHGFLTRHLMPHAVAEDRVLYPKVAELMGAPRATATMSLDHVEVVRLAEELGELRVELAEGRRPAEVELDLRRVLYGLYALVRVHFAEEEEIYLPILDERLSPEEADELFGSMELVAKAVRQGLMR